MQGNIESKKIILITGATGMIGSALCAYLAHQNYHIRILSRSLPKMNDYETYLWNPTKNQIDSKALDNVYGIIHLAGASIAGKRWTKSYKKEIYESRINSTRLLIDNILATHQHPKIFVSASGIAIYGDRPGEVLTEESPISNSGFLSKLCTDWEAETKKLPSEIRSLTMRTSLVLANMDGIYAKSILPAKLGFAPIMGSGDQIYSWIHIDDLVRAIHFILEAPSINGAVNMGSEHIVSQYSFAKKMARSFRKWAIPLPMPTFLLKLIVGELAGSMLESIHLKSQKLINAGFQFHYPNIEKAFENLKNEK